jgi:hypothetical protein
VCLACGPRLRMGTYKPRDRASWTLATSVPKADIDYGARSSRRGNPHAYPPFGSGVDRTVIGSRELKMGRSVPVAACGRGRPQASSRGMPARRPLLASQPSGIPARGFLHARTVFPRAASCTPGPSSRARTWLLHNVGPEAPYASWACQPAPATFAGYAQAYFQPASLRFFSHTPNTPNCATQ